MAAPEDLGGPNTFDGARVNGFVYASAAVLPDDRLLVSAAPAEHPTDFDLYIQEVEAGSPPQRLFASPGQDLDGVPVVVRELQPVIADRVAPITTDAVYVSSAVAYEKSGSFKFIAENIFWNAAVDATLSSAPPIGHNLWVEFYMVPQRHSVGPRDRPIFLAERRVPPSGRVEIELPAGVPLLKLLRTQEGTFPRGRDLQVFYGGGQNFGMPGRRRAAWGATLAIRRLRCPRIRILPTYRRAPSSW